MVRKNDAGLYEVEIDGIKYEFQKWGADDSLDVLLDIAKIIGKPLGAAFSALMGVDGKVSLDSTLSPDILALIFEAITERLDKNTIKPIIKKLTAENVYADKVKVVSFNSHYQDRLDHMFKVVQAALDVQYGNFFGALSGLLGVRKGPLTNLVQAT